VVFNSSLLQDARLQAACSAKIVTYSPQMPDIGDCVCAVGVFDGVHQGHQYLIGQAVAEARRRGMSSMVVTFDIDPDELFLSRERIRKLLSNADRLDWLAATDVDYVLVIPFVPELADTEPAQFLDLVFTGAIRPRGIHVGQDFRYGHKARGQVDDLRSWAEAHGCDLQAHILVCDHGLPVTATRIRDVLAGGGLDEANLLLTRPYYLRATVVRGREVGRELGFPTANISLDEPYAQIADGVYGGYAYVDDQPYKAAISVGLPATFEEAQPSIEAHLLDFDGNLYQKQVKLAFLERIRAMHGFESIDELKATVNANIAWVREHI
jgi:riboflavin kinase/FMN adenylyltransferase